MAECNQLTPLPFKGLTVIIMLLCYEFCVNWTIALLSLLFRWSDHYCRLSTTRVLHQSRQLFQLIRSVARLSWAHIRGVDVATRQPRRHRSIIQRSCIHVNVDKRACAISACARRLCDIVRRSSTRLRSDNRLHPARRGDRHLHVDDDRLVWNARRSVTAGGSVREEYARHDRTKQRHGLGQRAAVSVLGVGHRVRRGARSRQ